MKIQIKVGDTSSNKKINYSIDKMDNIDDEKNEMYKFLSNCNDCIIDNVDNFLLYTLNNGLMAYIVNDNVKSYDDTYNLIPKFNPEIYRVFEIKEDGTEICIQDDKGNIGKNYFNTLMKSIMDDYYVCLNFYV